MRPNSTTWARLATLAGVVALGHAAMAQGFVATEGDLIAAQGDAAPGMPGVFFHGSGAFGTPVLDSDGKVMFYTRLVGAVGSTDDRAYWEATTGSDLSLIVRAGSQAPGLAAGITLNSPTSHGLPSSYRLSPDGRTLWASRLDDGGATVTTANDSAIFGGFSGSLVPIAREGDPVPGLTGGETFGSLSSFSTQQTGMNANGAVLFRNAMNGTPGGSADNDAWFTGTPGSLQILQREGDTVLGVHEIESLGFISQMNGSGQILHDATLSDTSGTTPATTADDKVLFLYNGFSDVLVAREGQVAPGTGSFFRNSFDAWSPSVSPNAFNAFGGFLMTGELLGGDAVPGVNDRAMWLGNSSGALALVVRKGDVAAGTGGALWSGWNNSNTSLNVNGEIATQGILIQDAGLGIDDTNDTGIWIGSASSASTWTLILREGDPAPALSPLKFGSPNGQSSWFNNKGQLVFSIPLVDDTVDPPTKTSSQWAYDPVFGLRLALMSGDTFEVSPGVFNTVASWGGSQFNNGDGAALSFNHDGVFVQKVSMIDGAAAIVKTTIDSLVGVPPSLSVATGGVQDLYLNAGAANAGGLYLLLGSLSGTSPGIPVGPGQVFPLNFDAYLDHTLNNPNAPPLSNSFSTLDGDGRNTAAFTLPTGFPGFAGLTAHHAYAVLGAGGVEFISVAEPLSFLP